MEKQHNIKMLSDVPLGADTTQFVDTEVLILNIFCFSRLFAGVVPRTLSISAGGVVFFGVYEKAKWLLKQYTEL